MSFRFSMKARTAGSVDGRGLSRSVRLLGFLVGGLLVLGVTGCQPGSDGGGSTATPGSGNGESGDGDSGSSGGEAAAPGAGSLGGMAVFTGEKIPQVPAIPNKVDVTHCGAEIKSETIIIDPATKAVKNVVVTIEGVEGGRAAEPSTFTVANKGCAFVPHVTAVVAGSRIRVTNEDPINHNTHPYLGDISLFNVALAAGEETRPRPLRNAGRVKLKCDVHEWMGGWIVVHETPYFAVTGADGKFEIGEIPVGTYTVKAWHESFGEKTARVEIAADARAEVKLEFDAADDTSADA